MEWIDNTENRNILMVQNIISSNESDDKTYKYFTIYEKDKTEFLQLFAPMDFLSPWKFRIIEDKDELKQIIQNNFLSTNRTEEYDKSYTSVSRISNDLFPMNPNDKGLIYWMKNLSIESYKEQQIKNSEAQNKGTSLHLLIERFTKDKRHISFKEKYINEFLKDIIEKDICLQALTQYKQYKFKESINYIKDVLLYMDLIYSELFIKSDKYQLQGCVDNLSFYKGYLTLVDYKTTSKIDKKSGKGVFKSPGSLSDYKRQLCCYGILLEELGVISNINELEYKLNIFSFPRKEYRIYDFDKTEILNLKNDILHVIEWFNEAK